MTVASKPLVSEPAETPSLREASGRFALTAAPILALTQDAELLATLRTVSQAMAGDGAQPLHEVRAAGSEIDFTALLMAHHSGVAVLDCAAITTAIEQLTQTLQTQFPEVVLIVAGGIDEQGMLATQIADGSVHRFLHKPVSVQRVRLFVEAAWRRHAETRAAPVVAAPAQPARSGLPRRRSLAILAALIALIAGFAWFGRQLPQFLPHTPPPSPAPAPAPPRAASDDGAALESLLTRADAALEAGALTSPAGASAADLYREALRHDAHDLRALNGLEQVIERLIGAGETQLQHGHLDAAQALATEARAVNPDHPRVAFLLAQIGTQRERAVLGKAQRAAAGGNVAAALTVLDAASGAHRSTLVAEARQMFAQQQLDARITDFLGRGGEALARGALIAPVEANARFYIESARALAPDDARVERATHDLIARLASEARRAILARNAEAAETWTAAAADAGADAAQLAALRAELRQLRAVARADSLARLALAFNDRLAQGKIDEPATDSARFYLGQLLEADPAHPSAQLAREAYAARALDEARGALTKEDLAAARHWLDEARASGAGTAEIGALAGTVSAAEDESRQANTYVNESTLKRTRYVAPQFPDEARRRGVGGWVDLHFVVGTDGAVAELAVVGAEPVGLFEQAALDAVRRWRYQPLLRGGRAVPQRAQVRVRFTVQP